MRLILPLQAIRDGVIEAVLDHEHGRMQSKENTDIYGTREPQLAFHQRIQVISVARIDCCSTAVEHAPHHKGYSRWLLCFFLLLISSVMCP